MSEKHPGGRPLLYSSPVELEALVEDYFNTEEQVTLSGLAVHLGMGRRTLYEYDDRDQFAHIIKKAREKVERHYEKLTIYGDKPTGVIFALKNMGWKDRIDQTSGDKPIGNSIDYSQLSTETLKELKNASRDTKE